MDDGYPVSKGFYPACHSECRDFWNCSSEYSTIRLTCDNGKLFNPYLQRCVENKDYECPGTAGKTHIMLFLSIQTSEYLLTSSKVPIAKSQCKNLAEDSKVYLHHM